ncbi:MAG: hypothetical protein A2451_04270 [Bdellovibrionales bacterium RIFOXYC2_FULL_39_8]|nr:MAG: hypothetical protein A2451_04270 [Bdellovibrionales bacterium RIFOXYC2_FULL_39_8]
MLITSKEVKLECLHCYGPSRLRGHDNIAALAAILPEKEKLPVGPNPIFFKEQKFREFGGRSKSEPLLAGEEFYTEAACTFNEKVFFDFLTDTAFADKFDKIKINALIKKIGQEVKNFQDGEKSIWQIRCADDVLIESEFLIWGNGQKEFFNLAEEKIIDVKLRQFASSGDNLYSLFVTYYFDHPVTDSVATMFIPLSLTHEQGHFIGEFRENSGLLGKYRGDFLHFISEEESSEEEIARRVRVLRKGLEKIFGNSFKAKNDTIYLSTISPCATLDDTILNNGYGADEKLYFIGENAPLIGIFYNKYAEVFNGKKISHIARGILGLEQLKQGIII